MRLGASRRPPAGMSLALLVLWTAPSAAAPDAGPARSIDATDEAPTVGASLDRVEAQLGDRLTLTVSAVGRSAVAASLRLPQPISLGKFEILDVAHSDRELGEGKFGRRFVLQISVYDTGELDIPPILLHYRASDGAERTVATLPIPVHVKSLLEDESHPEPQPLKPARQVLIEDDRPARILRWSAVGAVMILLLAAIGVAMRRLDRRRSKTAPPPPPVPPHLEALQRIEALRARRDFARDSFRPFTFELAEILRSYLGRRFAFDSLELTTRELVAELGRRGVSLAPRIAAFLDESDLIKFAQARSSEARALAALAEVESLVLTLGAPTEEARPPDEVSRG